MCPDHDTYLYPVSGINIFSKNSYVAIVPKFNGMVKLIQSNEAPPNMFDYVGCKYVYIYSISLWIICS